MLRSLVPDLPAAPATFPPAMNIFVLSHDARRAARYHCNKHVVKMILESVQMLYTAWILVEPSGAWRGEMERTVASHPVTELHRQVTGEDVRATAYKPTHANHPCAKWVRESRANYLWLVELAIELCNEKRRRFPRRGKSRLPHKCEAHLDALRRAPPSLPDVPLTPFAIAINDDSIHKRYPNAGRCPREAVAAYRAFYRGHKSRFAKWSAAGKPEAPPVWFNPPAGVAPAV